MQLIKSHKYWRLLEIIPGLLTWTAILLPIFLSIYAPQVVAIFAIAYTTFWLFRSFRLSIDLVRGYRKTKIAIATDWNELMDYMEHPEHLDTAIQNLSTKRTTENRKLESIYRELASEISHLKNINQYKKPSEILHAILFVTYREPLTLIMQSIRSYSEGLYDPKKIILIFSGEESDKNNAEKFAAAVKNEFKNQFHEIITTIHPKNLPDEIPGKSANASWGAKKLQQYLDASNIPYENVILSNFDADTVVDKKYFSELTFRYLIEENRSKKTYQPTHFYNNNIWEVPVVIRMISLSSTFVRLAESMNPSRFKSFSSRSMGFQSAIDSNFWDPMIIPEDSRQYWTLYAKYHGDNELIQIYTPIYMDAVQSETVTETLKDQYKQLRRWAWGVTDFPFVIFNVTANKSIPFFKRYSTAMLLLLDHFYWATTPILLTFTGWLPQWLNADYRNTVLSYNAPRLAAQILNVAAIGIIISAILSFKIVPHIKKIGLGKRLSLFFQWIFVPIVSIFFSSIPAIESQTRLIFNRRLDYQVTKKIRKTEVF